jgi:[ribosomal protein S5]-alanine N-acetyltransferase
MVFLKSTMLPDFTPQLSGHGVVLRAPQMTDYPDWAELRAMSREHLAPWEPQWARDELTRAAFRRRLRYYAREMREDLGYAMFIFREEDEALVGGVTVSNVRRGVSQSAALGYWIGLPYTRRGYMAGAVKVVAEFCFEELLLHRIEAACLPSNAGSIRVLERSGFVREGLARHYLRINGAWQDHVLFSRLVDDTAGTLPAKKRATAFA